MGGGLGCVCVCVFRSALEKTLIEFQEGFLRHPCSVHCICHPYVKTHYGGNNVLLAILVLDPLGGRVRVVFLRLLRWVQYQCNTFR